MHQVASRKCIRFMGAFSLTVVSLAASSYAQQSAQHYTQTNLVSDLPGVAAFADPNLVNPWGLSRSSGSPWWASDNGTGLATLYDGAGNKKSLVVTIPPADSNSATGTPTGTIFNGGSGFEVGPKQPALFLFVTEDGTISGWNPGANATTAIIKVNNKEKSVFKGVTMATVDLPFFGPQSFLYVADFRKGRVQIYDSSFHHVPHMEEAFDDDRLPPGFAPFNVQNIGGNIYVAFAQQDSDKHDEVDGASLGYVDVFSPEGRLLKRLEHGPWFNAPWGLVQASGDFGINSHDILVGNFGSGEILAFDPVTGRFKGRLQNTSNTPITIDGLWGLSFGSGTGSGPGNPLYFSAGTNHEQDGLFGTLTPVENVQGNDQ